MHATTSESSNNNILPPMFDPTFQDYMDKRLKLLLALQQIDREEEEKICSCIIM